MTVLASSVPAVLLLEDYYDLCDFLEYAGRTVPRREWAAEAIRAAEIKSFEAMF